MSVRKGFWWLGLLLVAWLGAGCAGIISEYFHEDGSADRLRFQGGEKWRKYDRNPIKQDDTSLMLKKELTF